MSMPRGPTEPVPTYRRGRLLRGEELLATGTASAAREDVHAWNSEEAAGCG
jgi:hypothetical protein